MYRCYDKFMEENAAQIKEWMVRLQQDSINCLVTSCVPCVFEVPLPKKKTGKSGGTIRNPEPNMYYIVPSDDGTKYYGPFSIDIATANGPKYGRIFRQVNNSVEYEKAKLVSHELVSGTTAYLSGGKHQKNWYKENADKLARNSESPFVVSARYMTYDSFNGVKYHSNMDD